MTDITGGDVEIIARRMSAERLAVKRAHAARRPEGRTAELVAHIEAQAETIHELRGLIDGLECAWPVKRDVFYSREDGSPYFKVENVPCGKCAVCKAKQAAAQTLDGEGDTVR